MMLTRSHAELFRQVKIELEGNDLTSSVSSCLSPELIYFPTILGLLGIWNPSNPTNKEVLRLPVVYSHTASYPGDDRAREAEFHVLSKDMMMEFRYASSLILYASSDPSLLILDKQRLCLRSVFQQTSRFLCYRCGMT
jgi:hypothetical protein